MVFSLLYHHYKARLNAGVTQSGVSEKKSLRRAPLTRGEVNT